MKCERCFTVFKATVSTRRFCSRHCQLLAKLARKRASTPRIPRELKPRQKRQLFCHHCGGKHRGDRCYSRAPAVRHYGTVVDGEYVPYPGTKVRVLAIPNTIDGEQLTRILKETDP